MGLGDKVLGTLHDWVKNIFSSIPSAIRDPLVNFLKGEIAGSIHDDMFQTEEGKQALKNIQKEMEKAGTPLSDVFSGLVKSAFPPAYYAEEGVFPTVAKGQFENMSGIQIDDSTPLTQATFEEISTIQDLALLGTAIAGIGGAVPFTELQVIGEGIKEFMDYSGITQIVGYGYGQILADVMGKPIQHEMHKKVRPALMPMGELFDAYHRDIIDEDYLDDQLAQQGYTDDDIESLKKQQKWFPDPGTAIEWLAKEVYEEDMYTHFGLNEEFESLDTSTLEKRGLSEQQMKNFWIAHWQHPSWRRMRELYARTSVTKDDVMEWMKLVEYPPYWRDQLEKILYRPYTRVDIRRMYSAGVLDEEDVLDAMKEIRFDDDKAEHMKDFYIRWADNDVRGDLNDITMRKYRQDKLNRSDALSTLKDNGVRADKAKTMLDLADLQGPPTVPKEKTLMGWYKNDTLTETEARQYLEWIGYRQADIDRKITGWSSS